MPNVLKKDKQIAIIAALAEGMAIRQVERMTGIFRDTIMNYGLKVGRGCARIMDEKMRDLDCGEVQIDELWGFVGKKQAHLKPDDDAGLGDAWVFSALDADTKLVAAYKVAKKRDRANVNAFAQDLASRMKNRIQLSSDQWVAYADAVELAFGVDVDYGQLVKSFETMEAPAPQRRYSPPKLVKATKRPIIGSPNPNLISTSYVERLNGTTRHHMRRLTRLTCAFSKKFENFEAAVGLHFAYYNFCKLHRSIKCTPAQAANVERSIWTVGDLVEMTA
jgi:IS1 family transposase